MLVVSWPFNCPLNDGNGMEVEWINPMVLMSAFMCCFEKENQW